MSERLQAMNARMRSRRVLSVPDVAAHLDHRLYCMPLTQEAHRQGCADAVREGFAAVICRPERVADAAKNLAGTGVSVASAVGWDTPDCVALDTTAMLDEALMLAGQGVNEVALVGTRGRMDGGGTAFARQTAALVADMARREVRVRVILDTEHLGREHIVMACRQASDVGVWMVQGGSWRGQRTGFTQLEMMRGALGAGVLLKWTQPVRSLDTMLLCIAEGVGRFNADVDQLMAAARRSAARGPLSVPLPGIDY